jgi:hypothetical protein
VTLEITEEQKQVIDSLVSEEEKAESFNNAIRHLRRLQHEIDDTARQASIEINKLRSDYNHWYRQYEPFLRDYALEHAKVDKNGVKAKNYKSIAAGGGVYFRAVPEKIEFDMLSVVKMCETEPESIWDQLVRKEVSYIVIDAEGLVKQADEYGGIKYDTTPGDPIGKMSIGTERGWSPNSAKQLLGKALEGSLKEEVENE